MKILLAPITFVLNLLTPAVYAQGTGGEITLPFTVPSLGYLISFAIQALFLVAGLIALLFLLLGALSWITSGGNKENVSKAQEKIQAAIVGLLLIVAVLAIMLFIQIVVLNNKVCLGFGCPITLPTLLQ